MAPQIENTPEMVERLARALYDSDPDKQRGDDWDKESAKMREPYREQARHVIVLVNG